MVRRRADGLGAVADVVRLVGDAAALAHGLHAYSSWLNMVKRFLSLITDKAISRGSFTNAKQLVRRIDHFVAPATPLVGRSSRLLPPFDPRRGPSTLLMHQQDRTPANAGFTARSPFVVGQLLPLAMGSSAERDLKVRRPKAGTSLWLQQEKPAGVGVLDHKKECCHILQQ